MSNGGYKCECDEAYEGTYCERKKDMCKDVRCNYGYCVDGECVCDPKIPFCDKYSQCEREVKCKNGGTCVDVIVDSVTKGKCLCPPGLTVIKF